MGDKGDKKKIYMKKPKSKTCGSLHFFFLQAGGNHKRRPRRIINSHTPVRIEVIRDRERERIFLKDAIDD